MSNNTPQKITHIDWLTIFPSLNIFKSFKLALSPAKLTLSLMLTIAIMLAGVALDAAHWGNAVTPLQHSQLYFNNSNTFPDDSPESYGVYEEIIDYKIKAVTNLVKATYNFNIKNDPKHRYNPSIAGSLQNLILHLPKWLYYNFPGFFLLYSLISLALLAYFGTAISRISALQITLNQHISIKKALAFAKEHYVTAITAPLVPALISGLLGFVGLTVVYGYIFFNIPGLNILGGLFFFVALAIAFFITILTIGATLGSQFIYPAIAVESADTFDALSRAYNLTFARFSKWVIYNTINLFTFIITYSFIAALIIIILLVTKHFIGFASPNFMAEAFPIGHKHQVLYDIPDVQGVTTQTTAFLMWIWSTTFILLISAYGLSYLLTSQVWVYLLLRKANDDTALDDIHLQKQEITAALTPPSAEELAKKNAAPFANKTQNTDIPHDPKDVSLPIMDQPNDTKKDQE